MPVKGLLDSMGRDLCEEEDGWCYRETVSEYFAELPFTLTPKKRRLRHLKENTRGNIDTLRNAGHVSSIIMGTTKDGRKTMYSCGLVDRIMGEKGFSFDGEDYLILEHTRKSETFLLDE